MNNEWVIHQYNQYEDTITYPLFYTNLLSSIFRTLYSISCMVDGHIIDNRGAGI